MMKKIDAESKTLRDLLGNSKYSIDYYQREYDWGEKQVSELIADFAGKFLEDHDPDNDRSAVKKYGHYFLGSIVISNKNGEEYIIDGQQRFTTLTLILIFIYRLLTDKDDPQIAHLIFSQQYGSRSFNLEVEERRACMEALFKGEPFDDKGQPQSIINILNRFQDIEELFPDGLKDSALPYFADWLIDNVHLVKITTYSDADAYAIFETMNDRGLSLTPTDMLKGYLLANIEDEDKRKTASDIWRKNVTALKELGKEEDADCIKAWLRSQHAETIRERKRGALPRDFDLIGTQFHRWIRDHEKQLSLAKSADFANFVEKDFAFYAKWYLKLRQDANSLTAGLEQIHYNAISNFTLQYPILLAPITQKDDEKVILRKLKVTATYLDILIAWRMWNFRAIDYSTMQYAMFLVMRDIRGKALPELADILTAKLGEEKETFSSNERFHLHGTNRRQIHRLLARMTDFVATGSGEASRYHEYMTRRGKNGYEVEHIWANHFERHSDEFDHESDFAEYRNRIGGLILLPKSFNASYGGMPYEGKYQQYFGQNLLAKSLHETAYEHHPGFRRFVAETDLPFRAHKQFKKADLDARQELYRKIAEEIWNPRRLKEA